MNYILSSDGSPVPEPNLLVWAEWFANPANRRVASDLVGDFRVSTVFLGIDHSFGGPPPILWETMVFGPGDNNESDCFRCSGNREQAEAMHKQMLEKVKKVVDGSG